MEQRITKEDVDNLVGNMPESLFLTAEFRERFRSWEWWTEQRKKDGRRPATGRID